jgi:hypothetical protein
VPTPRNNNVFGKPADSYYEIGNVDDPLLWDESDHNEPIKDNKSENLV